MSASHRKERRGSHDDTHKAHAAHEKPSSQSTIELANEWSLVLLGLIDGSNLSFFIKCILKRRKLRKTYAWCCCLNLLVALGSVLVLRCTTAALTWLIDPSDTYHLDITSILHSVLWKVPLFLVSYPLNYVWLVEVFEEAYKEMWSVKKPDATYTQFLNKASDAVLQGLLLILVVVQTEVVRYVPSLLLYLLLFPFSLGGLGWDIGAYATYPITIAYEAWVYSFYAFAFRLNEQPDVTLPKKVAYFERRWMYFLGYGLLPVLLMSYVAAYDTFHASILYFVLLPIHSVLSVPTHPEKQQQATPLPIFYYANSALSMLVPAIHAKLSVK
eukprot:TRINITY_DN14500_c0_g2_i2.p1 TRINITY_DN14500_c0_g2~~TRINITY_DN14500_c0_g2_i2.p1  ORF type:complete len:328 (+),score=90.25 TRINITY_DN14500_c0_g2_i2:48-1031(+)